MWLWPGECRLSGLLFCGTMGTGGGRDVDRARTQRQRSDKLHAPPTSYSGLSSNWEDAYAALAPVDDNQCAGFQIRGVSSNHIDHHVTHVVRENILTANLQHAWAGTVCQGQHGSEVKVVCKDDVPIGIGPLEDGTVTGPRVADGRPVHGGPPSALQQLNPTGGQVHVDEDLDVHATGSATSRSSTRQAAYARACVMSSDSRYG